MSSEPTPAPSPPEPTPKEPADALTPLTIATRSTAAARTLHTAGVIDIDAGLALLEQTLEGPTFDALAAVAQLKQLKLVLFRAPQPRQAHSTTMSAHAQDDPRHELTRAAERAAATGDRNAVLTYMRAKRCFN